MKPIDKHVFDFEFAPHASTRTLVAIINELIKEIDELKKENREIRDTADTALRYIRNND